MKLQGKVALITGGGTGIGAAIAKKFADEGATICITGRRQEMLDNTAHSISSDRVATCSGDVTDFEDIQKMVDTAIKFGGKLDVLVNNAGIDPGGTILELEQELWNEVMNTNLKGPFLTMKASLPHIIKNGGGSVINISSLGGLRCLPGMAAYCTSKAGLIMLTKQAALDYGSFKVRCNAVCPGATRTTMLEGALTPVTESLKTDIDGVFSRIASNIPLHRVATPDEVAGICSFLASDESSFMTGAALLVDGGAAIVDISGAALSDAGVNWGAH